jgi:hypothetical protein
MPEIKLTAPQPVMPAANVTQSNNSGAPNSVMSEKPVASGTNDANAANGDQQNVDSSIASDNAEKSRLFDTLRNQRMMNAVASKVSSNLLTKDIVGK